MNIIEMKVRAFPIAEYLRGYYNAVFAQECEDLENYYKDAMKKQSSFSKRRKIERAYYQAKSKHEADCKKIDLLFEDILDYFKTSNSEHDRCVETLTDVVGSVLDKVIQVKGTEITVVDQPLYFLIPCKKTEEGRKVKEGNKVFRVL